MASGHYHITLRFLGDIGEAERSGIEGAVRQAAASVAPFRVHFAPPGAFPNVRRPQTLWLGVEDPTGRLTALQGALTEALDRRGIPPDPKPFHPHITLGRVRRNPDTLGDLTRRLQNSRPEAPQGFEAAEITLFKSDLTPAGPVYTPLLTAALTGPGRD